MTQRTEKRAAKWLENFATEHKDLETIRVTMEQRGLSKATIENQIGRLMTHGLIPDTRVSKQERVADRAIRPVPKPSAQPRGKGGRFGKKTATVA